MLPLISHEAAAHAWGPALPPTHAHLVRARHAGARCGIPRRAGGALLAGAGVGAGCAVGHASHAEPRGVGKVARAAGRALGGIPVAGVACLLVVAGHARAADQALSEAAAGALSAWAGADGAPLQRAERTFARGGRIHAAVLLPVEVQARRAEGGSAAGVARRAIGAEFACALAWHAGAVLQHAVLAALFAGLQGVVMARWGGGDGPASKSRARASWVERRRRRRVPRSPTLPSAEQARQKPSPSYGASGFSTHAGWARAAAQLGQDRGQAGGGVGSVKAPRQRGRAASRRRSGSGGGDHARGEARRAAAPPCPGRGMPDPQHGAPPARSRVHRRTRRPADMGPNRRASAIYPAGSPADETSKVVGGGGVPRRGEEGDWLRSPITRYPPFPATCRPLVARLLRLHALSCCVASVSVI